MKLTPRMILTFTLTLVLVLGLSLSAVFFMATQNATEAIRSKALVVVKTFEALMDQGVDQEGPDGTNEIFQRELGEIQGRMPQVTEINLYRVDLKKVVASSDPEAVGKEVDPEDLEAADKDQGVVLFDKEDGHDIIDVTEPLHDEKNQGKIDYVIGIKTDISADLGKVQFLVLVSLLLGIGAAVLGFFVVLLLARRVVGPLAKTTGLFEAMAEGDLSGRAEVRGRDETAQLAAAYNKFTEQFSDILRQLQEVSRRGRALGDHLAERSRAMDQGVSSIRQTVAGLQSRLELLNKGVRSPEFSLGDIQDFLRQLLADLEDQSGSVDRSRSTTHEMVEALQLISQETTDKLALADQLSELGRRSDAQMQTTVSSIRQVSKLTDGISEFIRVIHDVADRTNLLAMNASIEAAHAGASGRGFAVVAGEIRQLSEATTVNARNISASLQQMVQAVQKAEADVAGTGSSIHQLTQGVEHLSIAMLTVNGALQALSSETDTVTQAFDHLRVITDGVLKRSGTMGDRLGRMEGAMGELVETANLNATGFAAITSELHDLGRQAEGLSEVTAENGRTVEEIEDMTSHFRLEAPGKNSKA